MTREEAIKKLKSQRNVTCNGCLHAVGWCESHCKFSEAIDMAIEALKAQLSKEGITKGTTSDLISRTETVERLRGVIETTVPITDYDGGYIDGIETGISIVSTMPPAQPEERTEKRTETHGVCLDAISRQAAIDALDKQIKQCCKALGSLSLSDVDKHAVEVEMASFRAYRKMLENLPTAQPEPKWIPVSERLPKDGTWNIFTDGKNISVERYKEDAIDHFFPNGRWFQLEDVIAWMPLPEPYKPNKKQSGKEGA